MRKHQLWTQKAFSLNEIIMGEVAKPGGTKESPLNRLHSHRFWHAWDIMHPVYRMQVSGAFLSHYGFF